MRVLVSALVLSMLCVVSAEAQSSAYQDGVALYNKRAYTDAVKLLYKATSSDRSRDAVAHYYLANALMQLHRLNDAKSEYKTALELSPDGPVAAYCRSALKGLGMPVNAIGRPAAGAVGLFINMKSHAIMTVYSDTPASRADLHIGDEIIAVNGVPVSKLPGGDLSDVIMGPVGTTVQLTVKRGGSTRDYQLTRAAVSNSSLRGLYDRQAEERERYKPQREDPPSIATLPLSDRAADVDDMVETVKPTDMHPELTADFIAEVKGALAHMPPRILKALRAGSIKIVLTPTMIDKYPDLKNERPRGYHAGGSYKNCPAMFDSPNIVVCEYYFDSNKGQWLRQRDPLDALRHETGHALDDLLGALSVRTAFVNAYKQDFVRLTEGDKRDLSYYCYNDSGAHSETFAELASCLLGSGGYWTKKLAECFPHTTDAVRAELSK